MRPWEAVLLACASLVAVRALVTLMRRRHDLLITEVQRQVDEHRQREAAARRSKKQADEAA